MIKNLSRLFVLWMSILLLTSCWDSEDINKKGAMLGIGVDYVQDQIEFSGEVTKFTGTSKKEGEKAQGSGVYKLLSYGKTFEEGRKNYSALAPYPIFLGAMRVVVLGENYAKRGIEAYLNRIDNLFDYRKTVLIVVSRGPAREIFNVKVEKDISAGFLIENILKNMENEGVALYSEVGKLLSDVQLGKVGYLLPYIGIERNHITYLGLAVMKESKFIALIDKKDTDGLSYILSKKPNMSKVISSNKNKKNKFSLQTSVKKRKIKTEYEDGRVTIHIDLDLNTQLSYMYHLEPISDTDIKKLEEQISEKVKKDIVSIVEKAQNEFGCDIFQFARYFRGEHPKIFEKIDWEDAFKKADIDVNVKTKITNKNLVDSNAKKKY